MIDPLNLPSAAGEDFAEGDVQHLSSESELSSVAITKATRNLAHRDNLLTEKFNEVIEIVNNKEQYINLPTIRTTLPPLTEEVITNYRIAPGFEARVLNAIISSTPIGNGKLEIFYGTSYGATTGESLVSTVGEFSGETVFHGTGELIIKITNVGSVSTECVASIVLTQRPVSEPFGSLLGAGTQGPPGPVGDKGIKGDQGDVGNTGPQGSQGMVWRGPWNILTPYSQNDGVSFSSVGVTSSYIATAPHTGTSPVTPGAPWDIFAQGAIGATGSVGIPGLNPSFGYTNINGTLFTHGDYVEGTTQGNYLAVAPGTYAVVFTEITMRGGTTAPTGLAIASTTRLADFKGTITILLPRVADGGAVDYDQGSTIYNITSHGSNERVNTIVSRQAPRSFTINVPSAQPSKVNITLQSIMPIV